MKKIKIIHLSDIYLEKFDFMELGYVISEFLYQQYQERKYICQSLKRVKNRPNQFIDLVKQIRNEYQNQRYKKYKAKYDSCQDCALLDPPPRICPHSIAYHKTYYIYNILCEWRFFKQQLIKYNYISNLRLSYHELCQSPLLQELYLIRDRPIDQSLLYNICYKDLTLALQYLCPILIDKMNVLNRPSLNNCSSHLNKYDSSNQIYQMLYSNKHEIFAYVALHNKINMAKLLFNAFGSDLLTTNQCIILFKKLQWHADASILQILYQIYPKIKLDSALLDPLYMKIKTMPLNNIQWFLSKTVMPIKQYIFNICDACYMGRFDIADYLINNRNFNHMIVHNTYFKKICRYAIESNQIKIVQYIIKKFSFTVKQILNYFSLEHNNDSSISIHIVYLAIQNGAEIHLFNNYKQFIHLSDLTTLQWAIDHFPDQIFESISEQHQINNIKNGSLTYESMIWLYKNQNICIFDRCIDNKTLDLLITILIEHNKIDYIKFLLELYPYYTYGLINYNNKLQYLNIWNNLTIEIVDLFLEKTNISKHIWQFVRVASYFNRLDILKHLYNHNYKVDYTYNKSQILSDIITGNKTDILQWLIDTKQKINNPNINKLLCRACENKGTLHILDLLLSNLTIDIYAYNHYAIRAAINCDKINAIYLYQQYTDTQADNINHLFIHMIVNHYSSIEWIKTIPIIVNRLRQPKWAYFTIKTACQIHSSQIMIDIYNKLLLSPVINWKHNNYEIIRLTKSSQFKKWLQQRFSDINQWVSENHYYICDQRPFFYYYN